MTNEKLPTKFVTPEIICSYPHLAEKTTDLSGREAYTLSIPLPKDNTEAVSLLVAAMRNAAINEWGEKYSQIKTLEDFERAKIKHFVVDGNDDDPTYRNTLKFTAKSIKNQPTCVTPKIERVAPEEIEGKFYPGCIIRASVSAYATDKSGTKTIAWGLNNVMFIRDGERIGGSSRPEDDFADFRDDSYVDDPFSSAEGTGSEEKLF